MYLLKKSHCQFLNEKSFAVLVLGGVIILPFCSHRLVTNLELPHSLLKCFVQSIEIGLSSQMRATITQSLLSVKQSRNT